MKKVFSRMLLEKVRNMAFSSVPYQRFADGGEKRTIGEKTTRHVFQI